MKSLLQTVICISLAFCLDPSNSLGEITIIDTSTTISDNNAFYDIVVVEGDDTIVTMTGGNISELITLDTSTFNFQGGSLGWRTRSYDASVINIMSSGLSDIYCYDNSQVKIKGNLGGSNLYLYGDSVGTVSSHTAMVGMVELRGSSKMNVLAGSISSVNPYDYSYLFLSNGYIDQLSFTQIEYQAALCKLTGGSINRIYCENNYSGSEIQIFGYDLNAAPYGGMDGYGNVTGFWNDDTYFEINFGSESAYSLVTLFNEAPIPDCIKRPAYDFNSDCKVDFSDFAIFCTQWLDCGFSNQDTCWD